jgi:alpha-L-fucosidase
MTLKTGSFCVAMAAALASSHLVYAQPASDAPAAVSPVITQPESARWYRDAGFGLFIHWGLYSQAAGEWKGERYFGIVEHLMRLAKVAPDEYIKTLGGQFNPVDFNAVEWVQAAKDAGARYIIVTTKHHDGFAMYHSKVSGNNVVDATPWHHDPLEDLARECAKAGIRLGIYYSHVQDWSEPDAFNYGEDPAIYKPAFDNYMNRKALPQMRELMRNYGKISLVWYDTPKGITAARAQKFRDVVKEADPTTLITSRIGQNMGDIRNYGDSEMPDYGDETQYWEAIYTHNDSWGYSKFDHNFKSPTELIHTLATAASRGGNMVLNVGPDPQGRFPAETKAAMATIGAWLRANGESIYGSGATGIRQPWGVGTAKPGVLYLHILSVPERREILVEGIGGADIAEASLLDGGRKLRWRRDKEDIIISLPADIPASPDIVLALKHKAPIPPGHAPLILSPDFEMLALAPSGAVREGATSLSGITSRSYFGLPVRFQSVKDLKSRADALSWQIRVTDPGDFHLSLEYAADSKQAGQQGSVTIGSQQRFFQVLETGVLDENRVFPQYAHSIGRVHFDNPGIYKVTIRPEQDGVNLFTLKRVILRPEK